MEAIVRGAVVYPDSDGEPMADNTLQFQWIVVLKENLDAVRPDFVAGDLLWYPVEGDNRLRRAPDVLVALGRPKGHRGSYRQWEENGQPPDVVMEVLSPRNTQAETLQKLAFYRKYGAREFYVLDPDALELLVWVDGRDGLEPVERGASFRSPRLGITFVVLPGEIRALHADGTPFATFAELMAQRDALAAERDVMAARVAELEARLRELGVDPSTR